MKVFVRYNTHVRGMCTTKIKDLSYSKSKFEYDCKSHKICSVLVFLFCFNFFIRTHMQDMQDVTQEVHYENYRSERLAKGAPVPNKRTT